MSRWGNELAHGVNFVVFGGNNVNNSTRDNVYEK
jgi:hypothetical protein